jgi:large subunit ribosomal protein L18e
MIYGPENPEVINAIKTLSRAKNAKLFKVLANKLKMPRRKRTDVNLNKISRFSKPNSVVVVPGKVLAIGELKHKVYIVALSASETAIKKIKDSGSQFHDFEWLVKRGAKDIILIE